MNGEHNTQHTDRHTGGQTALVHTTGGEPSRTDRAVSWVGWHLGELAGIGAPLVLAVTVSPWWAALSGVVAAGWIAHEVHTRTTTPAVQRAVDQGRGKDVVEQGSDVSDVDGRRGMRGGGVA